MSYTDADGNAGTIRAKYVVDASGNKSRIYQRSRSDTAVLGVLPQPRAVRLLRGRQAPARTQLRQHLLRCAFDSGWFWYIPLTPTLTSVGAVVRRELASKIQGDPEEALTDAHRRMPDDQRLPPRRQTRHRGPVRAAPGPQGLLVREHEILAARHGTRRRRRMLRRPRILLRRPPRHLRRAARRTLHQQRPRQAADEDTAFREFEQRYRREYGVFYEFLVSFYDMHVDENSYFWSAKKVTDSTSSDLESFVSLVGGVSSGETAL